MGSRKKALYKAQKETKYFRTSELSFYLAKSKIPPFVGSIISWLSKWNDYRTLDIEKFYPNVEYCFAQTNEFLKV